MAAPAVEVMPSPPTEVPSSPPPAVAMASPPDVAGLSPNSTLAFMPSPPDVAGLSPNSTLAFMPSPPDVARPSPPEWARPSPPPVPPSNLVPSPPPLEVATVSPPIVVIASPSVDSSMPPSPTEGRVDVSVTVGEVTGRPVRTSRCTAACTAAWRHLNSRAAASASPFAPTVTARGILSSRPRRCSGLVRTKLSSCRHCSEWRAPTSCFSRDLSVSYSSNSVHISPQSARERGVWPSRARNCSAYWRRRAFSARFRELTLAIRAFVVMAASEAVLSRASCEAADGKASPPRSTASVLSPPPPPSPPFACVRILQATFTM